MAIVRTPALLFTLYILVFPLNLYAEEGAAGRCRNALILTDPDQTPKIGFTARVLEPKNDAAAQPTLVMAETPRLLLVTDSFNTVASLSSFLELPTGDLFSIQVIERNTGNRIGTVGFRMTRDNNFKRTIPLGEFSVKRLGYATEAKFALMLLGFDRGNISEITAIIQLPNDNSEKLHEKLGFQLIEKNYEGGYAKYQITAEQFRALKNRVDAAGGIVDFAKNKSP